MPAPVFELALTGSAGSLRATKQDLDTQINAGFLALWLRMTTAAYTEDFDAISENGLYRDAGNAVGNPWPGVNAGLLHIAHVGGRAWQIVMQANVTAPKLAIRYRSNYGVWTEFSEVKTTANTGRFDPAPTFIEDFDTIAVNGIYRGYNATGSPVAGLQIVLTHIEGTGGRAWQVGRTQQTPGGTLSREFRRHRTAAGIWEDWDEVLAASVIAGSFATSAKRLDTVGRFARGTDFRSLGINDGLLTGGDFPQSASDEVARLFGTPGPLPLMPRETAELLLIPPTEEQTNFFAPCVPMGNWAGSAVRMIPLDIRTRLMNSSVDIPLFEAYLTNGSGVLVWRYMGTEPLHTTIRGSIRMMARVSLDNPDIRTRMILVLRGFRVPDLEFGQGIGRRYLAQDYPSRAAYKIADRAAFNDSLLPLTQEILDLFGTPEASENLYVGSDPGYISLNVEDGRHEDLIIVNPPDGGSPVGPEVMTTKWMDVSGIDLSSRVIAFNFAGTSTRSRVQWRDGTGNIHYLAGSLDISSFRLIRLPAEAVSFRVYYTGTETTAGDSAVDVRAVGGPALGHDPLAGYWHDYQFDVNREVTFWPGGEYVLSLQSYSYESGSHEHAEYGYRFLSGGLACPVDAAPIRARLADNTLQKL